ncbi:MAG: hypothetical protein ACKVON_14755 [Beijerinckiaceae bacterium]
MLHYASETVEATKSAAEQKKAALRLLLDVFSESEQDGIDPDCMAQAAIFVGFKEFVSAYGEDAVATFAQRLPERIRNGEFTAHHHG